MALIKCNSCGHMVSDKGTKCPKCGMPIQKSGSAISIENDDKAASVVESKVKDIPHKENLKVETDVSIADIEKPQRSKKSIMAVIFGILVVTAIVVGYCWLENICLYLYYIKYEIEYNIWYIEHLIYINTP